MMVVMGFVDRMWGMVIIRDDWSFETWKRNSLVSLSALSIHIMYFFFN